MSVAQLIQTPSPAFLRCNEQAVVTLLFHGRCWQFNRLRPKSPLALLPRDLDPSNGFSRAVILLLLLHCSWSMIFAILLIFLIIIFFHWHLFDMNCWCMPCINSISHGLKKKTIQEAQFVRFTVNMSSWLPRASNFSTAWELLPVLPGAAAPACLQGLGLWESMRIYLEFFPGSKGHGISWYHLQDSEESM